MHNKIEFSPFRIHEIKEGANEVLLRMDEFIPRGER